MGEKFEKITQMVPEVWKITQMVPRVLKYKIIKKLPFHYSHMSNKVLGNNFGMMTVLVLHFQKMANLVLVLFMLHTKRTIFITKTQKPNQKQLPTPQAQHPHQPTKPTS